MTSSRRAFAVLLSCSLALSGLAAQVGKTAPLARSDVHAVLSRLASAPGDADRGRELQAMVERDYATAHACLAECVDARAAGQLRSALKLDRWKSADVVLRGALQRVEEIQGGVIDYHTLVAHFDGLVVERLPAAAADDRERASFAFARGTSHDWWLCTLIGQRLESITGDRLWLLTRHELTYKTGGGETGFVYYEFDSLPGAALPVLAAAK